ncbi:hypothetical protein INR49_013750, partial [Caranx melampygus]
MWSWIVAFLRPASLRDSGPPLRLARVSPQDDWANQSANWFTTETITSLPFSNTSAITEVSSADMDTSTTSSTSTSTSISISTSTFSVLDQIAASDIISRANYVYSFFAGLGFVAGCFLLYSFIQTYRAHRRLAWLHCLLWVFCGFQLLLLLLSLHIVAYRPDYLKTT